MSEKKQLQVVLAHCGVKPAECPLAENILRKRLGDLKLQIACPILNQPLPKDRGLKAHWPVFSTQVYIRKKLDENLSSQVIVVSKSVYDTLEPKEQERVLWIPNKFNYQDLIAELTSWKAKNLN